MLRAKILNLETGEFYRTVLSPESSPHKECLIGRHPNCDVVLDSLEVSRYHAKIVFQNGKYVLNDLNSTEGCRLNNKVVQLNEDYVLEEEDAIYIGTFLFLIEEVGMSVDASEWDGYSSQGVTSSLASTLSCVRAIVEAPDVKTFSFTLEPAQFFPYKPGQFLPLSLDIEGKSRTGLCPISSSPTRPLLEITLQQHSHADPAKGDLNFVSNYFFEQIDVGSRLTGFRKPQGCFTCCPDPPPKLLLISSESSVVPLISMLRWLYDTATPCNVILLYSVHAVQTMLFKEELEFLATHLPNFRIMVMADRSQSNRSPGWQGGMTLELLTTTVPDLQERVAYVAGANDFVYSVKALLQQLSFPMQQCHEEIL
jgi:glycine betaine catabolism B